MKKYRIDKGEIRGKPILFGLSLGPRSIVATCSFEHSPHPKDFNWVWNRLFGLVYFDVSELGVSFRHNPHTRNIELCGYFVPAETGQAVYTDYCPFPFMTLGHIDIHVLNDSIAFRFCLDNGVYIRKLDYLVNTSGPAFKVGPKMASPSHADIPIHLEFKTE